MSASELVVADRHGRRPPPVLLSVPMTWRREWPQPRLREWAQRHPDLFSRMDIDRRHKDRQPDYGFPEWAVAVELRVRFGLASIMKYGVRNDPWKVERLHRLLGEADAEWLKSAIRANHAGPPDLLVYDSRTWTPLFFAEAKLGRDRLRPNQLRFFQVLFERLNLGTTVFRVGLVS